ncbi:Fic/DOC family protein [Corynebacterium falsenii]
MANNASWERLFYPGTRVLRNKLNERNGDVLAETEYEITGEIYRGFISGEIWVEGETAGRRLQFIHRCLFETIYDWALEFRDVNMSKGGHNFGDHASMEMYMRQLDRKITRTPWNSLSFPEARSRLAEIHTDLNFAHPFREGNGRVLRAFMTDLAAQHGIELNFSLVDSEQWNQASADTFLDSDGLRLTPDPLKAVYRQIASHSHRSSY